MAAVTLPIVTTYNDKGVKGAQLSLKGLMTSQLGAAVSAGALVRELGKAVTAFADDERAQQQLKIAVQNSTGATDLQVLSMESQIAKLESVSAVADDKLRPSLTTLVRATKDLDTVSLALAKAQTGNVGALTRLGVSLDANAVKTKDLDKIERQLTTSFKGASEAAAASSAGGMAQLSITVDNLYELVGSQLSPAVSDFAKILNTLIPSAADKAAGKTNKLVDAFGKLFLYVTPAGALIRGAKQIAGLLHTVAGSLEETAPAATYTAAEFRDMDNLLSNKYVETLKKTVKGTNDLKKTQADARAAAKDYANTLRDRVVTAVDAVGARLQDAKDQLDNFAKATRDTITGTVSLTDAFRTQTDADSNLTDALKARKDAYADLAKLNPTNDAEAYAAALQKVAEAEGSVSSAQATRATANYSQVFQKQIADAKDFAGKLQWLIENQGLGQAGLQQLLNLGPTAGNQVAGDMINGVNGFTSGTLNEALGSLQTAGMSLGMAGGNAFFGGNVAAGQAAVGTVNNISIEVKAGLVSNPATVGREIIESIKAAERLSGQVFVSV